jgi:hypothetical protein
LHTGADSLRRAAGAAAHVRVLRAGEVEEVCAFGLVELERTRDRLENRL